MRDVEQVFSAIYSENSWGDAESRSGPGSTVVRTRLVRPAVTDPLVRLGVRSILDLACGDFNWMRLTSLPNVQYAGDLRPFFVPAVISRSSLNGCC